MSDVGSWPLPTSFVSAYGSLLRNLSFFVLNSNDYNIANTLKLDWTTYLKSDIDTSIGHKEKKWKKFSLFSNGQVFIEPSSLHQIYTVNGLLQLQDISKVYISRG